MLLIGGNMESEVKGESRVRVRINVGTSVKGVKTYDATVEVLGHELEDMTRLHIETLSSMCLAEHDKLIAMLDKRYPAGGALE
tara:strand:+ start:720 stop:968 length:249 start_codon:yes stop_codon:yes gene_type:complete